jgi:hypothetical protein
MKKRLLTGSLFLAAGLAATALTYGPSSASDHDDGEHANKERALNLTDHFAFRSPGDASKLSLVMYFNPRSLPGRQYNMAQSARYEFHVSKMTSNMDAATGKNDWVFRFEAGAPNAAGAQAVKLTVLKDVGGTLTEVGTHNGMSTTFTQSKSGSIIDNTQTNVGGVDVRWFVGQRADSFTFDVVRFFQVRNFLATRFFGKGANQGDMNATLAPNCRGDAFAGGSGGENGTPDHDILNLWNPPSCAPDFTHDLNVSAIVLNVPIAQLGGTIFDTWSTISVAQ